MMKDHAFTLFPATDALKMLCRPRKIFVDAPPKMKDKMLDLSKGEAIEASGLPYHSPNADTLNPTILPDRMMSSFAPVLIIRHPVKVLESWYRASRLYSFPVDDGDFEMCATYKFTRKLYDYYAEMYRPGGARGSPRACDKPRWPAVIDGDDLINDTEGIANSFCELAGLDPKGIIYKWEAEEITKGPTEAVFIGTLRASKGVQRNKV